MFSGGQRTRLAGGVRLLRYRFDSVPQVSRHFHVASGRVLAFYPCLLPLSAGEPVLLDVSFLVSDEHCSLRGSVVGKENGSQYVGWWLELSAHGVVSSLKDMSAGTKRRQRRFPTDALINLERGEGMPV